MNHNTAKGEEIKRKYEAMQDELKESLKDNAQLRQRVSELSEIVREWEYKY